jgi:hypothetical protein
MQATENQIQKTNYDSRDKLVQRKHKTKKLDGKAREYLHKKGVEQVCN